MPTKNEDKNQDPAQRKAEPQPRTGLDPHQHAVTNDDQHLQQQHIELTRQIEVAEKALKDGGGNNATMQGQIKSYKEDLQRLEARMKEVGAEGDPAKSQMELQKQQAQDGARHKT